MRGSRSEVSCFPLKRPCLAFLKSRSPSYSVAAGAMLLLPKSDAFTGRAQLACGDDSHRISNNFECQGRVVAMLCPRARDHCCDRIAAATRRRVCARRTETPQTGIQTPCTALSRDHTEGKASEWSYITASAIGRRRRTTAQEGKPSEPSPQLYDIVIDYDNLVAVEA